MNDNSKLKQYSHECYIKVQTVYDSLKTAEKKAADLLLEDPEFIMDATVYEAAARADCSEATFVRLSRKLGYSGFPDLKEKISNDYQNSDNEIYEDITSHDNCEEVVNKVFKSTMLALKDTMSMMNPEEYASAVDALVKANKIVMCGAGDSSTVARSAYQKFLRAGLNVHVAEDMDLQLIQTSFLDKDDILIVISHSGNTKSIYNVVKLAKKTGATVICVTNYPMSKIPKISDIVLLTAVFDKHINDEVISKRVTQICILESLYVNVLIRKREEMVPCLDASAEALKSNKIK